MLTPDAIIHPDADAIDGHVVYLIHLERPLKHARHYVGSTWNLSERMRCYRVGNSNASSFMRAVHHAGIAWTLAAVWRFKDGRSARSFEYGFKKSGTNPQTRHASRCCPYCREAALIRERDRMRALRARRKEIAHAG